MIQRKDVKQWKGFPPVELIDAEKLAVSMMHKHGLTARGWGFAFDRATSRLGACHFHKRKITISKHMAGAATSEQVEQTMLHEIAHAMLPPEAAHYKEWKALAKSLGYTGSRTAHNPYVHVPKAKKDSGTTSRKKAFTAVRTAPVAPVAVVGIGARLRMPAGKILTITKRGVKRWHAKDSNGKVYTVAFEHAHMFLIG